MVALVAAAVGCSRPAEMAQPTAEGKAARQFAGGLQKAVTADAMCRAAGVGV